MAQVDDFNWLFSRSFDFWHSLYFWYAIIMIIDQ